MWYDRSASDPEVRMARKEDFTEEEWEQLHRGVTGAGLLVSVSDRGFVDTFKEASAIGHHLADARRNSPSVLVRDLAQTKGAGFRMRSSPDEVESQTLAALSAAVATLEQKAPDEVGAYRDFVLEVAESAAAAAKGGDAAESGALEKIRQAVGAS
jgi:hypothetical protein